MWLRAVTGFVDDFHTLLKKQNLESHEEEHYHQSLTFGSEGQVQL